MTLTANKPATADDFDRALEEETKVVVEHIYSEVRRGRRVSDVLREVDDALGYRERQAIKSYMCAHPMDSFNTS